MENAEGPDSTMPMYSLLEYNESYSMTSAGFWNCYRDEVNDDANKNDKAGNYRINNNMKTTSKTFQYKTKIIGSTSSYNHNFHTERVVLVQYFKIFGDTLIYL